MTTRRTTPGKPKITSPTAIRAALITRARRLPMPGPGITISVALPLLPEYMDIYQLLPMTRAEVRDHEQRTGTRKPDGVLWVKRVKKDKAHA